MYCVREQKKKFFLCNVDHWYLADHAKNFFHNQIKDISISMIPLAFSF